jgi:DMSO/TMAO reductase YedYZ molybdopterin-dependent catalytic subunit
VVRKSKGFSWGPAGVSTALFTGVVMADVIRKARPTRKARYVCMEGADKLVSLAERTFFARFIDTPTSDILPAKWLLRYFRKAELGPRP